MRLDNVFNVLRNKFDLSLETPLPNGALEDADEMAASDMIPYTVHYDENTIITKDDGLVQVIKLDGLYFESLSKEQIRTFERQRNTVLRSIANSERGIYVHLVRRKISAYPEGEGKTWFAQQLNAAWRERFKTKSFFINEIYISVVRNRFRQGVPGLLDRAFSLVSGDKYLREEDESFAQQSKDIYEATNLLVQTLAAYGAKRLSIVRRPVLNEESISRAAAQNAILRFKLDWQLFEREYGWQESYLSADLLDFLGEDYSEIGSFFHYLINLEDERVLVSDLELDQALAKSTIDFKMVSNMMAIQNLSGTRAAAVLSMAEWPARTPSRMLDDFLRQPVEFIITQSFFFTDRISAEYEMRQERRRIKVNDTEGVGDEDTEELVKGLKDLTRGRSVNGFHHLTILAHVEAVKSERDPVDNRRLTVGRLDDAIGLLKKCFVNLGVKAVREWFAVETFFWSQLPGQSQHLIGRRGKIKSGNFAGFASLHNFAIGKIGGNLWGPAITVFQTEGGTPYYFNFHREIDGMVSGHTAITADSGGGKTVFVAMTVAMADKAEPRVFWFDNREGAKVFMCAMGGRHLTLTAQRKTGWNPCKLPDTPENRAYLFDLFSLMRTCYGGTVTPDDVEHFKKAIHENYLLPHCDRRLRNIAWCFGNGELWDAMRIWHGAKGEEGANAKAFDNEHDEINFEECRHYCFEMKELIKEGVARPELAVILSYPFHRIEQSMNGQPFILVLEEGQNLVKHAYWRVKIDNYIMQIRRKNGLLIFVTPDPKYLYCETDSIAKQTVTKIALPNGEARYEDYVTELDYTEAEYEFIRETPASSRKLLICRGNESIKVVFDLSDLSEYIPVLSSNDKSVAIMNEVRTELATDDPKKWVPEFMKRAQQMNTHNLSTNGATP